MRAAIKNRLLSPWIWGSTLILFFTTLGTVWFFHTFEKEEYEVYEGMSPQAIRNPLLAAQMYLQKLGVEAESLYGIEIFLNLPSTKDALLIRNMPAGLSKIHNEKLYNWVEAGGHLLLSPSFTTSDHPDISNILDKIGVGFVEEDESDCGCPPKDKQTESAGDVNTQTVEDEIAISPPTEDQDQQTETEEIDDSDSVDENESNEYLSYDRLIDIKVNEHDLNISYLGYSLLEDQTDTATLRIDGTYRKKYLEEKGTDEGKEYPEKGAWLLQYRVGAGQITVISDVSPFLNHSIDKYDHAYFLTWLLVGNEKIWLHYSIEGDSIFALIWKNFSSLLISITLLLIISIWYMQKRSGPRLPLFSGSHRNILAHIEATGVYTWKYDFSAKTIATNRQKLLRQWANLKKGKNFIDNFGENLTLVTEKSNIDPEIIETAFRQPVRNEQDLIRVSRAMSYIYKQLQAGEHFTNEGTH